MSVVTEDNAWKERLLLEEKELKELTDKLHTKLSGYVHFISPETRQVLTEQLGHMKAYLACLQRRIGSL